MTAFEMFKAIDPNLLDHYQNAMLFCETQPKVALKEGRSLLAEAVVLLLDHHSLLPPKKGGLAERINLLAWKNHLTEEQEIIMTRLRLIGNKASHSENGLYSDVDWSLEAKNMLNDLVDIGQLLYALHYHRAPKITHSEAVDEGIKELLFLAVVNDEPENNYRCGKAFLNLITADEKSNQGQSRFKELAKTFLAKAIYHNPDSMYCYAMLLDKVDPQRRTLISTAADQGHDKARQEQFNTLVTKRSALSYQEKLWITRNFHHDRARFKEGELSLAAPLAHWAGVMKKLEIYTTPPQDVLDFLTAACRAGHVDALNDFHSTVCGAKYSVEFLQPLIDEFSPSNPR